MKQRILYASRSLMGAIPKTVCRSLFDMFLQPFISVKWTSGRMTAIYVFAVAWNSLMDGLATRATCPSLIERRENTVQPEILLS